MRRQVYKCSAVWPLPFIFILMDIQQPSFGLKWTIPIDNSIIHIPITGFYGPVPRSGRYFFVPPHPCSRTDGMKGHVTRIPPVRQCIRISGMTLQIPTLGNGSEILMLMRLHTAAMQQWWPSSFAAPHVTLKIHTIQKNPSGRQWRFCLAAS
ncbi:hypothetical protein K469DRAFT_243403 [Zopfia rhizophila CBS 207.26]|uniref:Uncharacterized protein n=1 Tax=Zopfia rhizophila CBS 207.26 TaxID=1314779 RepID=A0A6A6ES02_9PEZI|nr:hypothetical protein K469DRAFT_243403 [Zopfia rhizophila CBS 207.26]